MKVYWPWPFIRLHWSAAVYPAGGRRTKARPAAAPGYPWPWPGAASPQALGRHPPPPQRLAGTPSARPPPPPSDRPAQRWASRCGRGGGGARTPPSWHQLGEKRKCWLWGPKNRPPPKSMSLQFLHQRVRRLFLGRYWKNHGDRTNTLEDIRKKHEGRAESAPPFQCAC